MTDYELRQIDKLLELEKEYRTTKEILGEFNYTKGKEINERRLEIISTKLKPLLKEFFLESVNLKEFKTSNDSLNKKNNLWGFTGTIGQMFFNQLVNQSENNECEEILREILLVPKNEEEVENKIVKLRNFIETIREEMIKSGIALNKAPKIGSIPYFLSYFWQIQDHNNWPIYYPNDKAILQEFNLFERSGNVVRDYINFKEIYESIIVEFKQKIDPSYEVYDLERLLFWYIHKNENEEVMEESRIQIETPKTEVNSLEKLPSSFIPPIVSIIPRLAKNDEKLLKAAKNSGSTLDRAFEKHVNAAFTILSFETELLGQGKGRAPDGLAVDPENHYLIIWDTKSRKHGYSMGTDDRNIKEYIIAQTKNLKRSRFNNIYFMLISSKFKGEFTELIDRLKMETSVSEVLLMEADALVEIVNLKVQDPYQISLGSDGIQRLFTRSGIINKKRVQEILSS